MEPFDRVWFGCCHSGRGLWNSHGQFEWHHAQRCRTFPGSKLLKTDANSRTKTERMPVFKITWAQISSRDARFISSFHAGAVVWPLLPDRDTFRRCFDLGFHDEMALSKSTTRQKGPTYADTRLSKYITRPVCLSSNQALNMWYSDSMSSVMQRPISRIVFQMLNGLKMCFHRSMPILKCFDPVILDFTWENQCWAAVY